jgi:hypothetical protein
VLSDDGGTADRRARETLNIIGIEPRALLDGIRSLWVNTSPRISNGNN